MSTKRKIMHMFFPGKNVSPFDVNMVADSGYDVVMPYVDVTARDVEALTQDCIYSRPPHSSAETGLFIGGWDVNLAEEMYTSARNSMQPPFEVSVMVDPNGAYTTSAAIIAMVSQQLKAKGQSLSGSRVTVLGGGPVGNTAAILAAHAGATISLARLTKGSPEKTAVVDEFLGRFDVTAEQIDAQTDEGKLAAIKDAQVLICSAKAGIQVLSEELVREGCNATVAADVNAVPPAGIAGIGLHDAGKAMEFADGCVGIGALAIGNVKYQTQQTLLAEMQQPSDKARYLGMAEALITANSILEQA